MKNLKKIRKEAEKYALAEIEEFGLPTPIHFQLSLDKGVEIAKSMKADEDIVYIGACLMDIKLGEAFKTQRLAEHVDMGVEASKEFLNKFDLDEKVVNQILNCVAAHHGTVPFESVEAEICANADSYRFLHPKGVIHYIGTLTKRGMEFSKILDQAEYKLDEKYGVISLKPCIKELTPFYLNFKEMFDSSRKSS